MASTRPVCASEVTRATPVRPRTTRPMKDAKPTAPDAVVAVWIPRISRHLLLPVGVNAGGGHDQPAVFANLDVTVQREDTAARCLRGPWPGDVTLIACSR